MASKKEIILSSAFQVICKMFNIKRLKSYQEKAMEELILSKQDCFICQPTGSGKSIIFQALPFFKHVLELLADDNLPDDLEILKSTCPFKVIVISPLNSLMADQEIQLSRMGFKVCCLNSREEVEAGMNQHQQSLQEIKENNLIFTSPEVILTNYRQLFREEPFQRKIVALAVDESHCVKNWGSSSEKSNAFRNHYSQLSELRSLVYGKVPMLALTATATKHTKHFIMENLCMINPIIISSTPERENIKYFKVDLKVRDIDNFLKPIIEKLASQSYTTEKLLIFCRVLRDVSDIYSTIDKRFRDRFSDYTTRPYAMFHSKTEQKLKDYILKEFSKINGSIRVLISTIAFGMGVNCKGLYSIVHFGPPASLEDYFQEAGRAGRDGCLSNAILVTYPRCLNSRNITKSVKNYCKNQSNCRRDIIFAEFGESYDKFKIKHLCCDVCELVCNCDNCPPISGRWWDQSNNLNTAKEIPNLRKGQRKFIRDRLLEKRNSISYCSGHCGKNILSGFPLEGINDVLAIATPSINENDLKTHTCIFNESLFNEIISIVKESFRLESEYDIVSEPSDMDSSADEHEEETTDTELSSNSVVNFHVNLSSDSESE